MPTDEFLTEENSDDAQPLSPEKPLNRSTGPKTPHGKARSSMNRLTHGCRSEKTVLPDENPAEFEFTVQAWFDHYQPAQGDQVAGMLDDEVAGLLVYETALAHWHFKRNSKRLEEIETRLPGDAWQWTPEHIHLFSTFSRYKTSAERAFSRRFKEVEAYYTRLHRREHLDQLAFAKLAAIDLKWLNQQEQKAAKKLKYEQIVEVEIVDGHCQTSCYPTNQEILEEWATKRPEKPIVMSRYILFLDGVPSEYAWANPTPNDTTGTLHAVQKMTWEHWLKVIEHEKSQATGHIGPCRSIFRDN